MSVWPMVPGLRGYVVRGFQFCSLVGRNTPPLSAPLRASPPTPAPTLAPPLSSSTSPAELAKDAEPSASTLSLKLWPPSRVSSVSLDALNDLDASEDSSTPWLFVISSPFEGSTASVFPSVTAPVPTADSVVVSIVLAGATAWSCLRLGIVVSKRTLSSTFSASRLATLDSTCAFAAVFSASRLRDLLPERLHSRHRPRPRCLCRLYTAPGYLRDATVA
mmetsp:Transcript_11665/g.28264  ORF Transcript_11665/g.28264 Transcript_11665/m.28264 type:complete len:219 (-) Transcript_11665:496-1152(-)